MNSLDRTLIIFLLGAQLLVINNLQCCKFVWLHGLPKPFRLGVLLRSAMNGTLFGGGQGN